jgi:nicotinamide-nucleotide amidase
VAVEIIAIGTELLTGRTTNTNLRFVGRVLDQAGYVVSRETCVPDTMDAVTHALETALDAGRIAITIGGLGPTRDDITRDVIAAVLGRQLQTHPDCEKRLRDKYERLGRQPVASIFNQALVPAGAQVIVNDWGTAPGLWCSSERGIVAALPGPPREFEPMVIERLMPLLQESLEPVVHRRLVMVLGLPESVIEARTEEALANVEHVDVSFRVGGGGTEVSICAEPSHAESAAAAVDALLEAFGERAVSGAAQLAEVVCDLVRQRGWRLATAESCTGGGIGARITDLAGVSDVYVGGVVSYANEIKELMLGVQSETLQRHGAVSEQTAAEMVTGLCTRFQAQAGIAVTGIAGPGGGTADKPVGLVYIGTCVDEDVRVTERRFSGDRRGVRERTVESSLNQLREHLHSA